MSERVSKSIDPDRPTIVLSACVFPQTTIDVLLTNADERRKQYQHALEYWERLGAKSDYNIVLAENSGSVDSFRPLSRRTLLLQCKQPGEEQILRGKGACEAGLVLEALSVCRTSGLTGDSAVIKITGRLTLNNGIACVRSVARLLKSPDGQILPRPSVGLASFERRWLDTRLIGSTLEGMDQLMRAGLGADDRVGQALERTCFDLVFGTQGSMGPFRSFLVLPQFAGMSGTTGGQYGSGLRKRAGRPLIQLAWRATAHLR